MNEMTKKTVRKKSSHVIIAPPVLHYPVLYYMLPPCKRSFAAHKNTIILYRETDPLSTVNLIRQA